MNIVSFLKVVYTLKHPSNVCLSYLDNGLGALPVRHLFTGELAIKLKVSSIREPNVKWQVSVALPFSSVG